MEIYAPIAHRLGMGKIRGELEDLAFATLDPEAHSQIREEIEQKRRVRQNLLEEIKDRLTHQLQEHEIPCTLESRIKRIYSTHQKIKRQRISIEQVYDLLALRIITGSVKDCYAALGIIHNLWQPVPGRIKDFIAIPRPNMYQSIHTSVIGPQGQPFEVQIRTVDDAPGCRGGHCRPLEIQNGPGNGRPRTTSAFSGCGTWWNGSRRCRIPATS